jgi:hypothetical protein
MQVLKSRFDLGFPHLINEFLIDVLALLQRLRFTDAYWS